MTAPRAARVAVLNCPACGGSLDEASSSAFVDCPSCGAPLAIRTPDGTVRESLPPAVDAAAARAAAETCWSAPLVPPAFAAEGRDEDPRLLWVAFYEVERTFVIAAGGPGKIVEAIERAAAADLPEVPIAALSRDALDDRSRRVPFRPADLQRRGLVFDPSREVAEALPTRGRNVLDERVRVVYLPLWAVRRRWGRNVYDVWVDGTTGRVLRGRAPAERTARLPQAIGALYLLAFAIAILPAAGLTIVRLLFHLEEAGLAGGLFGLAGLFWLAAWSWDRVRFRYETLVEGPERRLVAINRPKHTLPEKIASGIAQLAGFLLEARWKGGRKWR